MRKLLSVMMALILCGSATAFSACGSSLFIDDGGQDIDSTKTQLYVYNFNGGVGSEWLELAAARFEEEFADYELNGRTGVQIVIDDSRKEGRTELEDTLERGTTVNEIFFGEHMFYSDWADAGYMVDITDIVTEKLTEYGETRSIEDKLSDEKKAMLTSPNGYWDGYDFVSGGRYYALPHYEGFQGVTYNVTLFDRFLLYFNDDGEIIGSVGGTLDDKSAGPDGRTGVDPDTGIDYSADDGLPASIEQFMELCEYMASATQVTPFVWTGMYSEYFTILLDALVTAQLGKEGSEVLYTFNGDYVRDPQNVPPTVSTVITGFDGSGNPQLGETIIDETTGYLLWQRAELYYALQFADALLNSVENGTGQWYTNDSTSNSYDHLSAQADFVDGTYDSANMIGMLIDGNYWENEAADAIARSESSYNYDYDEDSNFAWMPLPGVATGDTGSTTLTLKDSMQAYAFIYSGIDEDKIPLAKEFLQFCYTDESLKEFTLTTGVTRDLDYDLTDEELAALSSYAQSIWNYRETADIVDTSSIYTVYQVNEEVLLNAFWRTQGTGTNVDRPYTAFWVEGLTAQEFFEGLAPLHTRTSWHTENGGYYDLHELQTTESIVSVGTLS